MASSKAGWNRRVSRRTESWRCIFLVRVGVSEPFEIICEASVRRADRVAMLVWCVRRVTIRVVNVVVMVCVAKRLNKTSLLARSRGDSSAVLVLREDCSTSHCMRSFAGEDSPLAWASWINCTRLATSGSNMSTTLLLQYNVGRLKIGMVNL